MYLDGSNAENKISLLVTLFNYVCKKNKKKSFFTKPITVKCLNIGKNIGKPIYRSISNNINRRTMLIFIIPNSQLMTTGGWKHCFVLIY